MRRKAWLYLFNGLSIGIGWEALSCVAQGCDSSSASNETVHSGDASSIDSSSTSNPGLASNDAQSDGHPSGPKESMSGIYWYVDQYTGLKQENISDEDYAEYLEYVNKNLKENDFISGIYIFFKWRAI